MKVEIVVRLMMVVVGLLLVGCEAFHGSKNYERAVTQGKGYEVTNVYVKGPLGKDFGRVVVMPLYTEAVEGEVLEAMQEGMMVGLSKQKRFEVVEWKRKELMREYGKGQYVSTGLLPEDFFEKVKGEWGAEGVLLMDMTHYGPYMPISIGLRGKLVDVRSGEVIWAVDEVFNSGDMRVISGMREYERKEGRLVYPLNECGTMMKSPVAYMRYVAGKIFETLPKKD